MSCFRVPCISLAATILLLGSDPARALTILPDAVGDSPINDIVAVKGGFNDHSMWLGVDFRSGTIDFSDAHVQVDLDTDLDTSTGNPFPNSPQGADFFVFYNSVVNDSEAFVAKRGSGPRVDIVGMVTPAFGPDSFGVDVPLWLLDGDDGVANFGAQSGIPADDPTNPRLFVRSDTAQTDAQGIYVVGGPTSRTPGSPIPEPGAALLFAVGGTLVAWTVRRRARA